MTVVSGKIEPLKKLKENLDACGISRFNSIADINAFISSYDSERKGIRHTTEVSLASEIDGIASELSFSQKAYDDLTARIREDVERQLSEVEDAYSKAVEKSKKSLFSKILYYTRKKSLKRKRSALKDGAEKIIIRKTGKAKREVDAAKDKLAHCIENKESIIAARSKEACRKLDSTKEVVDSLYPLIAGAIGESAVVSELKKLSDDFYLINDFSLKLNPPIYNRKTDDRIYSIQIDHLLISRAGLFVLETKNWSKRSVESLDLRSPVEQIRRSSYVLFILLNSNSSNIDLDSHHWGSKAIPIRNVLVMTNKKPKEQFKHLKLLSLAELNGYIQYFDPVFSPSEVRKLFEHFS